MALKIVKAACILGVIPFAGCDRLDEHEYNKILETREVTRIAQSKRDFRPGWIPATVIARAGISVEKIKAAGCRGFGKLTSGPDVRTTSYGYQIADMRCSLGVLNRKASHPDYPRVGTTYLSFAPPTGNTLIQGHGFQISYYADDDQSWLWYPGNQRSLPEEWKVEDRQICYRHPDGTYNPVTREIGGHFQCQSLRDC